MILIGISPEIGSEWGGEEDKERGGGGTGRLSQPNPCGVPGARQVPDTSCLVWLLRQPY